MTPLPTATIERALVAYAVLGDQIQAADMYEGLWEFIRPIIHEKAGSRFIPSEAITWLRERYALDMPVVVLSNLAERLVKAGILERAGSAAGAASYVYSTPTSSLERAVDGDYARSQEILKSFRDFVGQSRPLPPPHLTQADLDNGFFQRLLHIESLSILAKRDNYITPKKTENTLSLRPDSASPHNTPAQALDFVFSEFLLKVAEEDPESFDFLSQVAGANLVAEALLTYREPPGKGDTLSGVDLYIDGPLCMDILGVNVGREDFGAELHKLIEASGARGFVFHHTIQEVERVLEAKKTSYLMGTSSTQYPNERSADPPAMRDRVRALAGHVESALTETYGFQVVDGSSSVPQASRSRIGAAEERQVRDRLRNPNPEALDTDVQSACELMRLHQARSPATRLQDAGPVLLSRNSDLISALNEVWRSVVRTVNSVGSDRASRLSPIAMSEKSFCGIAWIAGGGQQLGVLSRARLVSNCLAATRLRKDVLTKTLNILQKKSIRDQQLFMAIINDQRAERALMSATRGDPHLVTDDTVLPLLEEITEATARDVARRKEQEIEALQANHRLIQEQANAESAAREEQLTTLQFELESLKQRTAAEKSQARAVRQGIAQQCFSIARRAYVLIPFLVALLIGTAVWFASGVAESKLLQLVPQPWNNVIRGSVSFLAFVVPIVLTAWDAPETLFGRWRHYLCSRILLTVSRFRGVEDVIHDAEVDFHKPVLGLTTSD